jgi:glycosyltransferase involved in cell wall biosynthesis
MIVPLDVMIQEANEESRASAARTQLTIIVPAFNESSAIYGLAREIESAFADVQIQWELLIVDDGSTDATAIRAMAAASRALDAGRHALVIRRAERGGAGAARKTGILAARGEWIAMLDADGSYDPADLPRLLQWLPEYDMVNGARTSEQGTLRPLRWLAKLAVRKLAEVLTGRRIPDLNTGMKVFKRDPMLRYLWCVPDGFSCVSSMTLAFLLEGHAVKYVPIDYRPRIGKSKFHPLRDTALYLFTVLRVVMYFRPLRVFGPLALVLAGLALGRGAYYLAASPAGLHESDVLAAVAAAVVLALGLLADLIAATRRAGGL